MGCIYHHQHANGFQRHPNIDESAIHINNIPCLDSETSLHFRLYLTRGTKVDYEGIERIIRSALAHSTHQKVWLTIVPESFGVDNSVECKRDRSQLIELISHIRAIPRIDQIGLAFDSLDRLFADDGDIGDIDFYVIRFSMIRKKTRTIERLKTLQRTTYIAPEALIDNSRYIEELNSCRYGIMMEYSSYEENWMVINDHGFIYQIRDNQK